eukprot:Em0009g777a
MSKAAEVPQSQLVTRMSAGRVLALSFPQPHPTSRQFLLGGSMPTKPLIDRESETGTQTPLYGAAVNGHAAVVEMLLKAGADVNKSGYTTPLHQAAEKSHYDVVAVLLSYNADGTIKDQKSARSVTKLNEQAIKILSTEQVKLILLQKWASIADERAATAERRATVAEERAIRAEETASVAIKTATCAEERSIAAEKRAVTAEEVKITSDSRATLYEERAISAEARAASAQEGATAAVQRAIAAEGRAITFEQRAIVAENECAITKQKGSEALRLTAIAVERAKTAERRATIAEERSSIANVNAKTVEQRAVIAEARATVAETRASVAEERIKVAEMEIIAVEKKASNATNMLTTLEERTRKAENGARMSDNRIAELVQTNTALEGRATTAELQIRDLTARCQHLQEQLDKANSPSWVLKKDDIVFSDKELGRGGWGVVMAARFCGLEVAAKLLHGAILSPHNQQLFMREMNIAALVRHPNILLFIGATLDQESVILTELMQTSLRAVLEEMEKNKLSMSRQQVSNIAMDVGKALNYLHLIKPDAIIHRDVSSANVLLERLGNEVWKAKLSDFGSSNFARQVATVAPGNFTYAAPESADPDLQSPKMDVFSYGILLLEMSHGHFPDMQKRQELIQKLTWHRGDVVIRHNRLQDEIFDLCCRAHPSVRLEKGNGLTREVDYTRPADILIAGWRGKPALHWTSPSDHPSARSSSWCSSPCSRGPVIPPNLSTDALKIFGEEVSSTIETLIVPERTTILNRQLGYITLKCPHPNATVESILESPITQTALSAMIAEHLFQSFLVLSSLASKARLLSVSFYGVLKIDCSTTPITGG